MILAADYDGTLFFHEDGGRFNPEDMEKAREFQEKGHLFVLNTGRPYSLWEMMQNDIRGKFDFDYRIFSNGSLVIDRDDRVLSVLEIPDESIYAILEKWPRASFFWHITPGTPFYGASQEELVEAASRREPLHVQGVSFRLNGEEDRQKVQFMKNLDGLTAYFQKEFVDLVSDRASKAIGLKEVEKACGKDHRTAAIGDSDNDLPAIREADYGFTFPWAMDGVQEEADQVVGSVAEAIDCLLQEEDAYEK